MVRCPIQAQDTAQIVNEKMKTLWWHCIHKLTQVIGIGGVVKRTRYRRARLSLPQQIWSNDPIMAEQWHKRREQSRSSSRVLSAGGVGTALLQLGRLALTLITLTLAGCGRG